jgi:hypothetical protein
MTSNVCASASGFTREFISFIFINISADSRLSQCSILYCHFKASDTDFTSRTN